MIANKCLFCGSSNLIADRALSGRLVCTSCGNPYGVRKVVRNKFNRFNTFSAKKRYWLFILILIFSIILVII
tara:strand:+ start:223 stop:438 length:216 start_codon:yes stop_codon:yes gene_type:complete